MRDKTNGVPKEPAFAVDAFTPDVVEALQQLSRDASTVLGRPVSSSAIIRALVRQVTKRGSWATDSLFLEVARERKA
jgi:hypothetical protein